MLQELGRLTEYTFDPKAGSHIFPIYVHNITFFKLQRIAQELGRLTEYTFDPKTGAASARRLTEVTADFPVVNPYRVGVLRVTRLVTRLLNRSWNCSCLSVRCARGDQRTGCMVHATLSLP